MIESKTTLSLKSKHEKGAMATCTITPGSITAIHPAQCGMWWVNGQLVAYPPTDKIEVEDART